MRSLHRGVGSAFALATAVLMTFGAGSVFAVLPDYAGWQTGNWNGIHGFLRQSTTVSTTALHAVWITICGHNDCNKWVQTGTYQGTFAGGSHPTQVRVYTENVDACGDYYVHDWGVPPAADTNYFISWNGASSALQYVQQRKQGKWLYLQLPHG